MRGSELWVLCASFSVRLHCLIFAAQSARWSAVYGQALAHVEVPFPQNGHWCSWHMVYNLRGEGISFPTKGSPAPPANWETEDGAGVRGVFHVQLRTSRVKLRGWQNEIGMPSSQFLHKTRGLGAHVWAGNQGLHPLKRGEMALTDLYVCLLWVVLPWPYF